MPAIAYRPATAADQPAITALIRAAGINRFGLKWPNFLLAVDVASGAVVATGQIKTHGDGSRELASIATRREYQRRGLAAALIHQLIARDAVESTAPLYLTCRQRMGRYYERFGFRESGPADLPPYFRRLWRFASVLTRLMPGMGRLLIMRLDKPPTAPLSPSQ